MDMENPKNRRKYTKKQCAVLFVLYHICEKKYVVCLLYIIWINIKYLSDIDIHFVYAILYTDIREYYKLNHTYSEL